MSPVFFSSTEAIARTYSTSFPLAENPISEGGEWVNGGSVGLDWSDVETTPGLAFGLESGTVGYTDGIAFLQTGTWGSNQTLQATVYKGVTYSSDYPEVEMHLLSSLSAHVATGYEISFSAQPDGSDGYVLIVRWNGDVGDFTYLVSSSGTQYNVNDGDVVMATVSDGVINAYKNGVLMATATDATFTTGAPGMGFNYGQCSGPCQGPNNGYGFTSFSATDGALDPAPSVPAATPVTLGFIAIALGVLLWRRKKD